MRRYVPRVNTILYKSAAWRHSGLIVIVVVAFLFKCLLGSSVNFMMAGNKEQIVCEVLFSVREISC